jgi:DNA helicase-2/ATP-dependent DNA helicase PcrA
VEGNGARVHRGGNSGGLWFCRQLFSYVQFYALEAYEDLAGEANPALDAMDVLTVHQAKGLEWPVVFVPGLSARRFPSSKAGRKQTWMLAEAAFPAASRGRYEGGEMDERRLFYVALTRARDVLYVSRFRKTAKQTAAPSPFLRELDLPEQTEPELPREAGAEHVVAAAPLRISFSDLAGYEACPFSYQLRALIGFEPQLAQELGYGRAVHSVLRRLAVTARTWGRLPTEQEASAVLEGEFYLPFANRPAFEQLKAAAWRLVRNYLGRHGDDLLRIWDTERPFELQVEGATVQGRADVIYHHEDGRPLGLALADYKTAADAAGTDVHAF